MFHFKYSIFCVCSTQILAVNGVSLLNLPYDESLKLLQNTGKTVELIVSQIFSKYQEKLEQQQQLNTTQTENYKCSSATNKSFGNYKKADDNMRSENNNETIISQNFVSPTFGNNRGRDTRNDNELFAKKKKYGSTELSNQNHNFFSQRNNTDNDNSKRTTKINAHSTTGYSTAIRDDVAFTTAKPSAHRMEYDAEEMCISRNGCDSVDMNSSCNSNRKTTSDNISFRSGSKKSDDSYIVSAKSMPDLPKVCFHMFSFCFLGKLINFNLHVYLDCRVKFSRSYERALCFISLLLYFLYIAAATRFNSIDMQHALIRIQFQNSKNC